MASIGIEIGCGYVIWSVGRCVHVDGTHHNYHFQNGVSFLCLAHRSLAVGKDIDCDDDQVARMKRKEGKEIRKKVRWPRIAKVANEK